MGPWPPKVRRFCPCLNGPLAAIQAQRRIERVEAPWVPRRVMKCAVGKALKDVQEGDVAGVDKSRYQKINFLNLMSLIIQS